MSSGEVFTNEDKALLQQLDEQIEAADSLEEMEQVARQLQDQFIDLQTEFRRFQHEVEDRFDKIERQLEDNREPSDDAHPIDHLSRMPADEREELLGTSDVIALTLHEHWEEIAWKLGDAENRRIGVDTKTKANAKYNPSRLKHRLKQQLDHDLRSIEIYRGLKRLATGSRVPRGGTSGPSSGYTSTSHTKPNHAVSPSHK